MMIIKIFLFCFLTTFVYAQEGIKNPVIIRNEDFKEGTTWNEALDQVYKKLVPKKSTKDPAKCFWMLGDGKYLIVRLGLDSDKPLEIEPMMIQKLEKQEKAGIEYLINKTEKVSLQGLTESIMIYTNLAKSNDVPPLIFIPRSKIKLSEYLILLQKMCELGVKQIFVPEPVKYHAEPPVIPLPKKPLPVSPHKK